MMKRVFVLMTAAALMLSLSACGKQESGNAPKGGAPGGAPDQKLALPKKGEEAKVNVPPDVKGKWKAVKLRVEDKSKKSVTELMINIGAEAKIPGSDLTVKAVEYLPSFVMQGMNISSASNDPQNPAAQVVITEKGQEVFKGWLFGRYPETHAFTHPKFSVTLVEGVKS